MAENPLDLAFDDDPVNNLLADAGQALDDAVLALTEASQAQFEFPSTRRRCAAYAIAVQDFAHQIKRVVNARRADSDRADG
jgi:hypothetical protein